MTPADLQVLRRLLADTEALLLDFDGPVCSVFAGLPAPVVVGQLCVVLADGGYGELPPDVEKSSDPFDVLKYAATLGDNEAQFVNAAFTAHEVEAIATAEPTPGADALIRAWSATARPLTIVSNNSVVSVEAYIDAHNLRPFVTYIVGRTTSSLTQLKPDPYLLRKALAMLDVAPGKSTFVGDSATDIEAARAAGVRSIGYANKPGKELRLAESLADIVVTRIDQLTQSLILR